MRITYMRYSIKNLLAAGVGALLAVPALGQTTTTTSTGQNPSAVQLAPNNPGVIVAQGLTTAQFSRLFGGFNAAVNPNATGNGVAAANGMAGIPQATGANGVLP